MLDSIQTANSCTGIKIWPVPFARPLAAKRGGEENSQNRKTQLRLSAAVASRTVFSKFIRARQTWRSRSAYTYRSFSSVAGFRRAVGGRTFVPPR